MQYGGNDTRESVGDRDVDQRLAERDSERDGETRLCDPDVFNEIEALDLLGTTLETISATSAFAAR